MKQAYWGFLAGMVFMAAVIAVEIFGLTPRVPSADTEHGAGVVSDLRDC